VSFVAGQSRRHLVYDTDNEHWGIPFMSKDRRERTIHWDDPPATAREGLSMAGRDYRAAMSSGSIIELAAGRIVDRRAELHAAGLETCLGFDRSAEPQ
jgi:hypothetical protein